ncbi:MAG: hypothetical protein QW568_02540 [Candidatus Anstonellaceae archaeon]
MAKRFAIRQRMHKQRLVFDEIVAELAPAKRISSLEQKKVTIIVEYRRNTFKSMGTEAHPPGLGDMI